MCELPNDAARRKALDTLPPTLNATYERILRRVNQSNAEIQQLVRRTLQWLVHGYWSNDVIGIDALREALSIEIGDKQRNIEAIPDEKHILRWCSSLVRKSANGFFLELAHFTVMEFLFEVDNDEFAAFGSDEEDDSLELAQICLTYLNLQDFDQEDHVSIETTRAREDQYPFRHLASNAWPELAHSHRCEIKLLPFLEDLFNPSKSNNFLSWANNRIFDNENVLDRDESELRTINSWVAEASPLHFAAMEGLPELCTRLIERGCDLHRNSAFGTPLHCAVMDWGEWLSVWSESRTHLQPSSTSQSVHRFDTVKVLLKAGADPNALCDTPAGTMSPVSIAMRKQLMPLILHLLQEGGLLDDASLDCLERANAWKRQDLVDILQNVTNENTPKVYRERLTRLTLVLRGPVSTTLADHSQQNCQTGLLQNVASESALRLAAEFGQLQIVARLLKDDKLQVDSRQEQTGLTALHYAVGNDHTQIAKELMSHGANLCQPDSSGRAAIHHSVNGRGGDCLSFLIQQTSQIAATDLKGLNILHFAAQIENLRALRIVLNYVGPNLSPDAQTNEGETALMLAARAGNTAAVKSLLLHGCDPNIIDNRKWNVAHFATRYGHRDVLSALRDSRVHWHSKTSVKFNPTPAQDTTALHIAASLESCTVLEYLLSEGIVTNINAVSEHSTTALHAATWFKRADNVSLLLSHEADPTIANANGDLPLHLAARLGFQTIALIFTDFGCDLAIPNSVGLIPELLARICGHGTLANELRIRADRQGESGNFPLYV